MPSHSESRILPHSPEQIFDLVADVEKYPEFLPWCSAARIRSRTQNQDCTILEADLVISFKVFREKFASKVELRRQEGRVITDYIDGPFKFMHSTWDVTPHPEGCAVAFSVNFEMKNVILQKAVGIVFNEAMQRIVRAFDDRAKELYG